MNKEYMIEEFVLLKDRAWTFLLIGLIALIGNWIGYNVTPEKAVVGMLIIVLITVIGWAIRIIFPVRIPIVVWISLLALFLTSPLFPGSEFIINVTKPINFLALATPILAYAGLSFGKDMDAFKKMGWRIIVISLVVYTGTFLLSSVFAEIMFRIQGQFH